MNQGELFPKPPSAVTKEQIPRIACTAAEMTWLEGMDPTDRPAAIAWIEWKKANFKIYDKLSRPDLWMEGFLLGLDYSEHTKNTQPEKVVNDSST